MAVTGYQIFKDGTLQLTVSGSTTACNVVGLDPDTTYTFRVEAGDAAGNLSTDGPAATATTAAAGDLTGVYIVTPVEDAAYTTGATADGIRTMTVKSGITGNRTFSITVNPVVEHPGDEKLSLCCATACRRFASVAKTLTLIIALEKLLT